MWAMDGTADNDSGIAYAGRIVNNGSSAATKNNNPLNIAAMRVCHSFANQTNKPRAHRTLIAAKAGNMSRP